jgi:hypothetical protein
MSDINGASDLDNDTPGLGPQTGNVRGPPVQLPSALQGLAQRVVGRQNPKFLPPKPGPQQNQQQQQKPQLGSTDPPDPSTRAFAPVPRNAPQRPPGFTPYTPPVPRDPQQWGQPDLYPRLPKSFELNGMYGNLGGYFAQHGSFASQPLAAGLATNSKAYQDAFQKRQDFRMKQAMEMIKLHAAQLEELETNKSLRYADIYNMYSDGGDPNTQTINGVDMRHAVWQAAIEMGDNDTIQMMEGGKSIAAVMRQQAAHEAHVRALSAANKKTDEVDAQDALYDLAPARDQAGTDPWDRDFRQGGQAGGAAPTRAAPAAAPSGAAPKDTDARVPGAGDDPVAPDKQKDDRTDNQKLIDEGAWDMVEGYKPDNAQYGKMTQTIMAKRKLEMEQSLKNIALDPNLNRDGKHPEEVLDAVRQAVPEAASTLDQYSQYKAGPGVGGRSSSGGPEAPMWGMMEPLAAKMYPGDSAGVGRFSAGNFAARLNFTDKQQYQNAIGRVATSAEIGAGVVAASNNLPPEASDPNVFKRAMKQAVEEGTGDERYVALSNAFKRYNAEMNVLIRGGQGGQGETMENIRTVNQIFATPANYRVVVAQDAAMAQARLNQFKHQWAQIGGGPMPGSDPDTEEQLRNLANMEPIHQVQPGTVVPGSKWSDGKPRVWLGPFDSKGRLRQNPDDNWDLAK